jgi:penicillin-binding protein 1A
MEWEVFLFFLFASWNFRIYAFFEDLENPDSSYRGNISWSSGNGKFFRENRSQLKYTDLPKTVDALVATEDERFMNTQE